MENQNYKIIELPKSSFSVSTLQDKYNNGQLKAGFGRRLIRQKDRYLCSGYPFEINAIRQTSQATKKDNILGGHPDTYPLSKKVIREIERLHFCSKDRYPRSGQYRNHHMSLKDQF